MTTTTTTTSPPKVIGEECVAAKSCLLLKTVFSSIYNRKLNTWSRIEKISNEFALLQIVHTLNNKQYGTIKQQ